VMAMRTLVRAVVRDREGRVIRDTGWRETNTLTKNFFAFLRCAMRDDPTPVVRTDGTTGTIATPSSGSYAFMECSTTAGITTWGLLVGTGTTEPTRDDYNLESKIPPGTGAGRLEYGASDVLYGPDYVEVRRSFNNASGGDITIREVGLVACYRDADAGADKRALIARSLFTVTIPDGGSATLYYRIQG